MSSEDYIAVAAIDFGTTYSGYGFSTIQDYSVDPLKVTSCTWTSGQIMSLKTTTTILFRPDQTFDAFGYEAEDRYNDLSLDNMHTDWFYFRRFKMMLYAAQHVHRDTPLKDETGKEMPALVVFSECIRYMKGHLMNNLERLLPEVQPTDIKWVLTVPAIWDDAAKQFMREAAVKAGIDGGRLLLALEPEAASMFCKHLPVERQGATSQITCFSADSRYLVLDAGGGTVDITVHEVNRDGTLRELVKANGGAWGGTMVDKAFVALMAEITGQEVLDKFHEKHQDDYIDLMRAFEVRKRSIQPTSEDRITFKIPISLHELYREMTGGEMRDAVKNNQKLNGKVSFAGDKMRTDATIIKALFEETCTNIVDHLRQLLKNPQTAGTRTILMVGGFSESQMLAAAVQSAFSDLRVVVPHDAGLAVLKGAVIFGHNSHVITSRIAKYTYGVSCVETFDPKKYPKERMVIYEGRYEVRKVFSKLVEIGQSLSPDSPLEAKQYFPRGKYDSMEVNLYASPQKNPMFVDETDAIYIGKMHVDCKDHKGRVSGAYVSLIFGDTELRVKAVHDKTGEETAATFDFL
ncbi:heat shock 70 kDa protein 12B-like [Dreissena polymorpha]|uniref:Uncharacterized protein n=1 Tax=Dreissena polymorpha TaxID=45954 RepID=A0A9D4KDC7_DREPO|nr:heat shock 70 kDa protein 12B-like [Dreissena polymorpha]XP_052280215.1 heat shock 70 kDa protein 12B-like [Dreissena polymorpha]KAH3837772.1 hypothetical protein DPMN_111173 [Dreissena polymorpha]